MDFKTSDCKRIRHQVWMLTACLTRLQQQLKKKINSRGGAKERGRQREIHKVSVCMSRTEKTAVEFIIRRNSVIKMMNKQHMLLRNET